MAPSSVTRAPESGDDLAEKLLRRNLDPILMRAGLQLAPVGGRHVPVDDSAIGLRDLAVRHARRLHGIIDINAANQQQRTQNHSDKRLHGIIPPLQTTTRMSRYGSAAKEHVFAGVNGALRWKEVVAVRLRWPSIAGFPH